MSIYASFMFPKHELEYNGALTHQMMKFSKYEDHTLSQYAKMENLTMGVLVKAIRKRLCDNFSVYRFLEGRLGTKVGLLLFAIPTVEFNGTERGQLKFVSSHEGLKRILLLALKDLGCEYTLQLPDIVVDDEDPMTTWTLAASTVGDFHELRVMRGKRRLSQRSLRQTNIAMMHAKNTRLAEILYVFEHTNAVGPNMNRCNQLPLYLDSVRRYEVFRLAKTNKTSSQIMDSVRRELDSSQVTLGELWSIAMDCAKLFL